MFKGFLVHVLGFATYDDLKYEKALIPNYVYCIHKWQ